jgi:RNA polymerase sigma factor (sigma-70 family)
VSGPAQHDFLALLDSDPVEAGRKYHALRSKLVFYFRHNSCADPDNLADETIERAFRSLSSGAEVYAGVAAYCYGVARNVVREERRKPRGQELPDEIPQRTRPPGQLTSTEQGILLRQALETLTEDDRRLFTSYCFEDRDQLARSEKLTSNALRIRVFRIRQHLQEYLKSRPGGSG